MTERLTVSVSIFPVYDLVRRVAGPDADVTLVVPVGKTEHGYTPTPKDTESVNHARVVVMVGLGLDPWMEGLATAPKARILKVGDRVPTLAPKDDTDSVEADPHVWLDAERARLIVRAVAEELGRADAPHAIAYRTRATELDTTLAALDKEIEMRTKALTTRSFVSTHLAFAYFGERYKLETTAIEQTPGTPPNDAARAKLVETLKTKTMTALFSEPQLDSAPVKALADETKLPIAVLDPLGGSAETDTYEKLLRADLAALEKYLK